MNVLVTGGAGYIGSVCVEKLSDQGHKVLVVDSLVEGHRAAVDPRARFENLCLSERAKLAALLGEFKPEAVVHFAAFALVGESMVDPGKYFQNNVTNGLNLLDACVASGVKKFVFSSTCATYGPPDKSPITESTPQRPANPYGESKLIFEKILRWYRNLHKLEYTAFRYFNAAGCTEKYGEHRRIETHLIPNVLKVALGQSKECHILGTDYPTPDGTCVRDYIHIADLVSAHIIAMEPGKQGLYNLGIGKGYSVREVIRTCQEVSGKSIPAIEKPRRPGDPAELVADASKALNELGWKPQYTDLRSIVQSAWNWHAKFPNGYPD